MIRTLQKVLPAGLKSKLLGVFRRPVSAYLRHIETTIPKITLDEKHVRSLQVLTDRDVLLSRLPKDAVVAELGVDRGDFSQKIIDVCQPRKLHLVDFWGSKRYNQSKRQYVFDRFSHAIDEGRLQIHLGLSVDVAVEFQDAYFDWIYIDTDHTYQTTILELEKYAPKVKAGGIIAGHDYSIGNWVEMRRYGVIEAVHAFCVKQNWEFVYLTIETDAPQSFAIKRIGI